MRERLSKGIFVCSIDTELAWGFAHQEKDPTEYEHWGSYARVRETVDRILELMDRYEVQATWAVVGRLLVNPRDPGDNSQYVPNPQVARKFLTDQRLSDDDFLSKWYAPELLERIRSARVKHEIGSHMFSHVILEDDSRSREVFDEELSAVTEQAASLGLDMKSFIFPKNQVAHTDVLQKHGFKAYRTVEPSMSSKLPRGLRQLVHRLDAYLPIPPHISYPERDGEMWVLPATTYYRHSGGWAKRQSNFVRTAKLKAGVRKAARKHGMFHIWFHPYDVASDLDRLIQPLEQCFAEVAKLRDEGVLENLTMSEVADKLEARSAGEPHKSSLTGKTVDEIVTDSSPH